MKEVDEAGSGLGIIVGFGNRGVQCSGTATTVEFRSCSLMLPAKICCLHCTVSHRGGPGLIPGDVMWYLW
jgi:hypothetical protein